MFTLWKFSSLISATWSHHNFFHQPLIPKQVILFKWCCLSFLAIYHFTFTYKIEPVYLIKPTPNQSNIICHGKLTPGEIINLFEG